MDLLPFPQPFADNPTCSNMVHWKIAGHHLLVDDLHLFLLGRTGRLFDEPRLHGAMCLVRWCSLQRSEPSRLRILWIVESRWFYGSRQEREVEAEVLE